MIHERIIYRERDFKTDNHRDIFIVLNSKEKDRQRDRQRERQRGRETGGYRYS